MPTHIEEAVGEINGSPGDRRSFESLHRLLEAQHYRLAYWRVAADEVNYRRFFDINELAGLRVDREDLFELTHHRVFEWIERGQVHGLRIDHIDGLADPRSYCQRIRQRFLDRRLYLVVEKILARHEKLRPDWPVDGTTGYEFLNLVNGLLIDPAGERPLDRTYQRFADRSSSFDDILYTSKKNAMSFLLGSELQVLANQLDRIAESDWRTRDFTLTSVKEALKEIIACFPVYRTYVSPLDTHPDDRREIERAVEGGRKRSSDPEPSLFHWIQQILAGDLLRGPRPYAVRGDMVRFITKFQQYTPPVMAKGLEDTSFYRHHGLVSLNEVGGDPRRFGISPEDFHAANQERAAHWPRAMLTTSTHDTKRGEDLRARIDVLSEIPGEWRERVRTWAKLNRRFKEMVEGRPAPTANHEYLLYQTLIGSWPVGSEDAAPEELPSYRERIDAYMIKAAREGKESSSWQNPDAVYEKALSGFVQKILDPAKGDAFLADLLAVREAHRRARSDEQPLPASSEAHLAWHSGHLPRLRALGPLAGGSRQPKPRGLRWPGPSALGAEAGVRRVRFTHGAGRTRPCRDVVGRSGQAAGDVEASRVPERASRALPGRKLPAALHEWRTGPKHLRLCAGGLGLHAHRRCVAALCPPDARSYAFPYRTYRVGRHHGALARCGRRPLPGCRHRSQVPRSAGGGRD